MKRAVALFLGICLVSGLDVSTSKHKQKHAVTYKDVFKKLSHFGSKHHAKHNGKDSVGIAKQFVAELLQTGGHAKVTPEVDATVQQIITSIDTDMIFHIKQDHEGTQEKIDSLLKVLKDKSLLTQQRYTEAVLTDTQWYNCVNLEVGLVPSPTVCLEKPSPSCNAPKIVSYTVPVATRTVTCDFANGNTCQEELYGWTPSNPDALGAVADLEVWLNNTLRAPGQNLQKEIAEYKEARKATCAQELIYNQSVEGCTNGTNKWAVQRKKCQIKAAKRQVGLCRFGDVYQHKCEAKTIFQEFIDDVETRHGNVYSDPDRRNEYEVATLIKCILQAYLDTKTLDPDSLTACSGVDDDFNTSIGVLNKRQTAFDTWVTPYVKTPLSAYFDCTESGITFHGKKWTVPAGDSANLPLNTTYIEDAVYAAPIQADPSLPAFTFCAVSETGGTCAANNFNAADCNDGVHDPADYVASNICQLTSTLGCTAADCCNATTR